MGKVRRGTDGTAEMEEKGSRGTVWSGMGRERLRSLGGHGNYIFMRWFRQMALCRQKEKGEERGDENRKRETEGDDEIRC